MPSREVDEGGEAPCYAHLFQPETADPVLVKLGDLLGSDGGDGAVWSLPANGDLNVNLVQLGPNASIEAHRNSEVDVVVFVRSGDGEIVVDDRVSHVAADHLMFIPRDSTRAIHAGNTGLDYLSIHRARGPMTVGRRA